MRFDSAIADFNSKNAANRIPDFRPGKEGCRRRISQERVDSIVTHARNALRRASGLENVEQLDIQPYLIVLPAMAHLDATEAGRTNPANEASAVRTFLRVVAAVRYDAKYKPRVKQGDFLPDWTTLAQASMSDTAKGRASRNPGWLQELQNTLLRNGIRSPMDLPDYETVQAWSLAAGHTIKDFGNHIGAYRKARELVHQTGVFYPAIEPATPSHVRGLTSIPNLEVLVRAGAERRRQAGETVPEHFAVDTMETLDLLDYIAPQLAYHTRMYVDSMKENNGASGSWLESVVDYSGCLVAELVRMGENVVELDHLDLMLQRRQIPRTSAVAERLVKSRRAVSPSLNEDVSLYRKVVDTSAIRSAQASPLSLEGGPKGKGVAFYTPSMFNQTTAMWSVTEFVYGKALGRSSHPDTAEEWREVEAEHDRVVDHMKKHNETLPIIGHATRGMLMLTWGAAICVGLRELWISARRRRTAWHQAYDKYRDEHARPVRLARRRYLVALEKWVVAAVFLDDGLRVKQYARGRLGVNFILDGPKDPVTGKLCGVAVIYTRFRGYDTQAGFKMSRTASGQQRLRHRQLTPGIVDAELMTDYVFELRLDRLMHLGLVTDRASYDPANDGFAFFVSTGSTKADGRYHTSRLSKKVGQVMHHIARDLVDVRDENGQVLPTWSQIVERSPEGDALRKQWRAVWNSHPVRRIITTYFGGILGDWHEAECRTNDAEATLKKYYFSVQELVEKVRRDTGLNNPERYVNVVRRLVKHEVVDWATFDPWHQEQAHWVPSIHPPQPLTRGSRPAA